MISQEYNLVGKFLIAMPGLQDPNFERAVIFVCAHSSEGALGLVINQPHTATMEDVVAQLSLPWNRTGKYIVYQGGPVSPERGFVLHERLVDIPGSLRVAPDIYMATNPEVLNFLAQSESAGRFLFTLGYSGWGTGQLEMELRQNSWLVGQMDRHIVFELPPPERWQAAIRRMGIDPAQLVDAGQTAN
ncbi:MAG: YqgE/AlgH family protein [Magnetococcales bacterium]|nr:YqgE/AlgH family protein [Magnetococcales bacterium]MBF0323170.1 YqgE/AlgH family protein [Magnetococcales bacterium]